jgi:2Fe-2S ferredoxin
MPIVVYVQPDGTREEIDVPVGYSVMEGATMNGIDSAWLSKLPPMDALEDAMLDSANERNETSRLTCQISMTDELDGLTVTVVPPY